MAMGGSDTEQGQIAEQFFATGTTTLSFGWQITAVAIMTCGTVFLMWLGEQIDEYGIGNGISLLIMAGILAQMPKALWDLRSNFQASLSGLTAGNIGPDVLIVLGCLFIAVVFAVSSSHWLSDEFQPTRQSMFEDDVSMAVRSSSSLSVSTSRVMPIIFASSLLMIPGVICGGLATLFAGRSDFWASIFRKSLSMFQGGTSFMYNVFYVALIFFFCYFWTSISFNPKEMSENLKDHGTFIPGYRPGKRTADYLEKVMVRITYVGAAFLAIIAIVPTIVSNWIGVPYNVAAFYGGTGLLIAVSVAFDLIQKIDNHLLMRNYKGLLES